MFKTNVNDNQAKVAKVINRASEDLSKTINILTKTMCEYDKAVIDNAMCDAVDKISPAISSLNGSFSNMATAINNIAISIDKGAVALSRIADGFTYNSSSPRIKSRGDNNNEAS